MSTFVINDSTCSGCGAPWGQCTCQQVRNVQPQSLPRFGLPAGEGSYLDADGNPKPQEPTTVIEAHDKSTWPVFNVPGCGGYLEEEAKRE